MGGHRSRQHQTLWIFPFHPGPGMGGHCIPIDPYYLSWKAREYDFTTRFIFLAGEINVHVPYYVVAKVRDALNGKGKSIKEAKILILGVAYKRDVEMRETLLPWPLWIFFEKRGRSFSITIPISPLFPSLGNIISS